jgi:hypothetical protein
MVELFVTLRQEILLLAELSIPLGERWMQTIDLFIALLDHVLLLADLPIPFGK